MALFNELIDKRIDAFFKKEKEILIFNVSMPIESNRDLCYLN